jgi:acyl-CoA thioesterase
VEVEPLGGDCFIARRNEPSVYGVIVGGQLMGQALAAADATAATAAAQEGLQRLSS